MRLRNFPKGAQAVNGQERFYMTSPYFPNIMNDLSTLFQKQHQLAVITEYSKQTFTCVQFSSVPQLCPTLCDPMNCSSPGLPVHHHLPEFTQTHVQRVGDTIQLSHPLFSPFPPAPNPSQHQSLFQLVNSSHEVAKVLEFQL